MNTQRRQLPILDAEFNVIANLRQFAAERRAFVEGELPILDAEIIEQDEWCDDCGGSGVVGLLGDDRLDVPCFTCNGSGRAR